MEFLGISSSRKQLLPGILDEITLGHIVPKLPWTAFLVLSSVSRWWRATIRTREAYDARVASDSTETLVVFNYLHFEGLALALYSPVDNVYHRLPPIRQCFLRSGSWCQFIALDGKLYVLGGKQGPLNSLNGIASAKVYMLDIAGQRQWKLCASMEERRLLFGCGVLDGKIYVFGGNSGSDRVTVSEVYDPKVDTWSRIARAPMKSYKCPRQVITVGKVFCMHGRNSRNTDDFDKQEERLFNPMIWNRFVSDDYFSNLLEQIPNADSWEVYHPASDMWRMMEPPREGLPKHISGRLFMAQGEIYSLSKLGIHHLESDKWTLRGSLSCDALGPSDPTLICPIACIAVGDEILAMVQCYWSDCNKMEFCVLRSSGFGNEDTDFEWQKLLFPLEFGQDSLMCLIQL